MTFLLTSTSLSSPKIKSFFLKLINHQPQKHPLAFIPTAADTYDDQWFIRADQKMFIDLGFSVTVVDLKSRPTEIAKKLKNSKIIFMAGGNTFYLLYWLKKSHADKVLRQMKNQSCLYLGSSAGAIVPGPDIESAGWPPDADDNDIRLKDTTGLNLTDFVVYPHFQPSYLPYLTRYQKTVSYPVIPLSDSQAVYSEGKNYQII